MYKHTADSDNNNISYLNNNNNNKMEKSSDNDNIATIDVESQLKEINNSNDNNNLNVKNNNNNNNSNSNSNNNNNNDDDNNQLELFNNNMMNIDVNKFNDNDSDLPEYQTKQLTNYGSTSSSKDIAVSSPVQSLEKSGQRRFFHKDDGRRNSRRLHCHTSRIEGVDVKAKRKLIIASILCLIFMIGEIVGGFLSNSLAIATDAAHLLTDFASFMISLFAIWLAGRPATHKLSFGWYRAEVIGALVSVLMIWVITVILVWLAIERVINKTYEVNAQIMLITSGLAIVVNIIMGVQLGHGHSHGGGGGHSHSHNDDDKKKTKKELQNVGVRSSSIEVIDDIEVGPGNNKKQRQSTTLQMPRSTSSENHLPHLESENMNVRAAFIHVLGDMLQSIGVFIAAIIIYCRPEWAIADPICTFVFSIIVLFTTFKILKDALMVLMEGTPNYLDYSEVVHILQEVEGVQRVHNLRIWALSLSKVALSVHLVIHPGTDAKTVLQRANRVVHQRYKLFETTFQIEEYTMDMESCTQCVNPVV